MHILSQQFLFWKFILLKYIQVQKDLALVLEGKEFAVSVSTALPQGAEYFIAIKKNEDVLCFIRKQKQGIDHSSIQHIFLRLGIVLDTENTRVKVDRYDPSPCKACNMYPISPFY